MLKQVQNDVTGRARFCQDHDQVAALVLVPAFCQCDLMQSSLRKIGNSAGVISPAPILDALGVTLGARFDVSEDSGRIVLAPVTRKARDGWEDGAKRIGRLALTEEERDWLNMPYDFDAEWEW